MPDTCVPCPLQSVLLPSPVVLVPQTARPPNSGWVVRMPVSITYAVTLLAVVEYEYLLSSGRSRWSTRSRPHDGGFSWSVVTCTVRFCCTYATAGSAASLRAASSLIVPAKPRSADL